MSWSSLQRWNLLWRARRELSTGAPERALAHLTGLSGTLADELRARSVDELCRSASERADQGRDASAARILTLVESADPERARHWRSRLAPRTEPAAAERPNLRSLLSEMRAEKERPPRAAELVGELDLRSEAGSRPVDDVDVHGDEGRYVGGDKESALARPGQRARSFVLGVDDAGEFLVAHGPELVLGHQRAGRADLLFLADVAPEHVRLVFGGVSFHGGATWQLEPLPGQVALHNGALVERGVVRLRDGDAISLAPNLTFLFRQPDPAAGAAVLELLGGADCLGAPAVLLFGDATTDRVRIGAGSTAAIRAPALAHDVVLERCEGALALVCAAGFWLPEQGSAEERARRVLVSDPLPRRIDLAVGEARPGRAPFGLYLAPLEGV